MHECPFCGEICDCDMDDTWDLSVPDDCPHVCDETNDYLGQYIPEDERLDITKGGDE